MKRAFVWSFACCPAERASPTGEIAAVVVAGGAATGEAEVGVGVVGEVEMEDMSCLLSLVDQGSPESHRYYLARRTVLEMLRDRGYDVPASEIDLTLSEFRERHGPIIDLERLRFSSSLVSDPAQTILVIFGGTGRIKITDLKLILGSVAGQGFCRLIFILQGDMTAPAKKATLEFPFKVEMFRITDLLTNITKHALMPQHEILSSEEKERILRKYSLEEKQLPCMLESDAIARYYGLKKGQVVKVTYNGDIAKGHITYRCVV